MVKNQNNYYFGASRNTAFETTIILTCISLVSGTANYSLGNSLTSVTVLG